MGRRRGLGRFVVALVVVFGAVFVLQHWNTDEYSITPGDATLVAPLVKIKGVSTNSHHDKIMLTDVYLTSLTAWQWIGAQFESHVQFVNADELVEPGVPANELGAQGFLQMSDAKQAAEVAAFRALGWRAPSTSDGTVVTAVVASSPASRAPLHVGDLIVGVDGTAIRSSCQLITYVHNLAPKTVLDLRVDRVKISSTGVLSYRRASTVHLVTATASSGAELGNCGVETGEPRSFVGVGLENGLSYELPAKVSIDTADIGGPSAGLAMTLSLINELSSGSLTGHHVIAATGTVAPNGEVGPVGGVEEKAVAVRDAGASYFIVPLGDGNLAAARAADQPGLKILAVTSLKEALRDLRALGGVRPVALTRPS